jgi:serine/threonine protein phosphatase 1
VWNSLRSRIKKPRARVADGIRVYAIGDVHGRADLLEQLLARLDADLVADPPDDAVEVFLGDYIDRGPHSREVLDLLIARSPKHQLVCLKGNHETYIPEFLKNPAILSDWRDLGGLSTLLSYGLAPSNNANEREQVALATALNRALPDSHRRFLDSLKLSFTCGDFFFVHAGVRPGIPLAQQREDDLLWIREDFLLHEEDFGKVIVHGHTPVREPDIRSNRINIDTGAYATGQLTCLKINGDKMVFL